MINKNIFWQFNCINNLDREKIKGHKSALLWFTGLSGSGKSTIANKIEVILNKNNIHTYILDGDNLRHGLCSDLDFNIKDRKENIRRVAELSKIMVDAGLIVLTTLISPYRSDRNKIRNMIKSNKFFEIFVDTPINICEDRDPKGLYKKARLGEINNFTGIDENYEKPINAEIYLKGTDPIDVLIHQVLTKLLKENIIFNKIKFKI